MKQLGTPHWHNADPGRRPNQCAAAQMRGSCSFTALCLEHFVTLSYTRHRDKLTCEYVSVASYVNASVLLHTAAYFPIQSTKLKTKYYQQNQNTLTCE